MVSITALNEGDLDVMCVYRIWFGRKFYIGSTTNSYCRLIQHQQAIKRGFEGHRLGKNSITNIVMHLVRHREVATAFFEVVELCVSEVELVEVEYKWLQDSKQDSNCLNYNYHCSRKIGNTLYRPHSFIPKQYKAL